MQTAKKRPQSGCELFSAAACTLAAAVWFRWGLAVPTGGLAVRQWYHWLRCRKHQMDDPGTAEAPETKHDREYE